MKLFGKVTAMAMASMMMFSLAACGGDNAPASTSGTTEAAPEEAAPAEKEEAAAPEETAPEEAAPEETEEAAPEEAAAAGGNIGVCIYKFDDAFMTTYRNALQEILEGKGYTVTFMDGKNDQAEQNNQINNFIAQGVDALIINPVMTSAADQIIATVKDAGVPTVLINREPTADQMSAYDKLVYVGCDARQSGTMQGEMIVDLGLEKVDLNGDGKVQYIMIEGDPENVDAKYRTEFSVKALVDAGWEVEELDDQVGNWDQVKAQELVSNALGQHGEKIEVVFCNNDAMALGALQAIDTAGRKVGEDIFLVGVDALSEALENVMNGTMTGTVFNDHISQSHSAADAAVNYLTGAGNEHYIGCDYVKVTTENAQEVLDSVK